MALLIGHELSGKTPAVAGAFEFSMGTNTSAWDIALEDFQYNASEFTREMTEMAARPYDDQEPIRKLLRRGPQHPFL